MQNSKTIQVEIYLVFGVGVIKQVGFFSQVGPGEEASGDRFKK